MTDTKPTTPKPPCECHSTWEEHVEYCADILWDEPHLYLGPLIRTREDAKTVFDMFLTARAGNDVEDGIGWVRQVLLDPDLHDDIGAALDHVRFGLEDCIKAMPKTEDGGRYKKIYEEARRWVEAIEHSDYVRDLNRKSDAYWSSPEGKKAFSRSLDGVFGAEPPTGGAA